MAETIIFQSQNNDPVQQPDSEEESSGQLNFFNSAIDSIKKRLKIKLSIYRIGNIIILISIIGLIFFYFPLIASEVSYRFKKTIQPTTFGDLLKINLNNPVIESPDFYFGLVIPKIDAKSKVIANVDTNSPKEYRQALKQGVAHAKGTVFPGMNGTIYLFAHSASAPWDIIHYNAVFYLLRELEIGDLVVAYFQGIRYDYRVFDKMITSNQETSFFGQKEREILVLHTCYPPGTTRQALLIFAERKID